MPEKPGPDPTVEPEEILSAIKIAYSPALGTSDIAEEIDLSQQATLKHLERLDEEGYLDSRKIGRVKIWWLTDEGKKRLASYSSEDQ